MTFQRVAAVTSILVALGSMTLAQAAERPDAPSSPDGFYGGVSLRDTTAEGVGINFGAAASSALNRFSTTTADDTATRALVFGGYRWQNDLAVEASFSSLDKYSLRPLDIGSGRRGVGLTFGAAAGDVQSRSWNLDVFTSWNVYKAFALYGRLGYAQSDPTPVAGTAPVSIAAARGLRDGMNYGVGVRYDMNSTLGLRLEYSRFGSFAGEIGSSLPETDQVTFGLQVRF